LIARRRSPAASRLPPPEPRFFERAFALAEQGRYSVSPNPMVGAVVVRDGHILGEGFHRRAGEAHAEVLALRRAGDAARGADLYVTLEPCAHLGRTPPCASAVAAAGIRRVFVAAQDPNPLVSGRGSRLLRRAGIELPSVDRVWRERAADQNEKFLTWAATGRPFVLAKWAATLDGRIASAAGQSRWITGTAARRRALLLREEYDAVLVGAGTIAADDPRLTRRLWCNTSSPHWRIVLDGRLRTPPAARLFRESGEKLVVTAMPVSHPRARQLEKRGVRVWSLPSRARGRVNLRRFLLELARHEVTSLMVEGGGQTTWAFLSAGFVDRIAVFLAPRILGGSTAPGGVGGEGFALRRTPRLSRVRVEPVGHDLLVTGRVE